MKTDLNTMKFLLLLIATAFAQDDCDLEAFSACGEAGQAWWDGLADDAETTCAEIIAAFETIGDCDDFLADDQWSCVSGDAVVTSDAFATMGTNMPVPADDSLSAACVVAAAAAEAGQGGAAECDEDEAEENAEDCEACGTFFGCAQEYIDFMTDAADDDEWDDKTCDERIAAMPACAQDYAECEDGDATEDPTETDDADDKWTDDCSETQFMTCWAFVECDAFDDWVVDAGGDASPAAILSTAAAFLVLFL